MVCLCLGLVSAADRTFDRCRPIRCKLVMVLSAYCFSIIGPDICEIIVCILDYIWRQIYRFHTCYWIYSCIYSFLKTINDRKCRTLIFFQIDSKFRTIIGILSSLEIIRCPFIQISSQTEVSVHIAIIITYYFIFIFIIKCGKCIVPRF